MLVILKPHPPFIRVRMFTIRKIKNIGNLFSTVFSLPILLPVLLNIVDYCIPMLVTLNLINHDIFAVIFHSHRISLVIFHDRGISQRIFNG